MGTSKHINNTGINGLTIVRTIGLFTGVIHNTIQRYNATMGCDRGYLQGKNISQHDSGRNGAIGVFPSGKDDILQSVPRRCPVRGVTGSNYF